jgi:DDE superfamily endonuclease/Helix-turn-helix of DDE superfamily endonuclease
MYTVWYITHAYTYMDIHHVLNNRRLVRALLGVTKEEFLVLLPTFEAVLLTERSKNKRERAVGGGSNGNIKQPIQKLFFVLFYAKCYPTFDVAAFFFASSKSCTHRWAHAIVPLLEQTLGRQVVLPARRISSPEEFLALFPEVKEVMLDGVERPTVRSQKSKSQIKHYSGKKKRHTRKNIVVTDKKKRILFLSPSKHGKVHDKKLLAKAELHIPESVTILADTGLIGLQKEHTNTLLPAKKPKGGFLTAAQKAMNHLISSCRMPVEHAIGGMKRFRCVSEINRSKNGWDDSLVNVAAGLWNLHVRMA